MRRALTLLLALGLAATAGCAVLRGQLEPVPVRYVENDLDFEPVVRDMLFLLEQAAAVGCPLNGLDAITMAAFRDAVREWVLAVEAAAEEQGDVRSGNASGAMTFGEGVGQ